MAAGDAPHSDIEVDADGISDESDEGLVPVGRSKPEVPRAMALVAYGLFGLQFIFLCVWSGFLYHRFTLGIDFADYGQAVSQISHGNLNPYLTILHWPYIGNNFELITWPIALLLSIVRSLYLLLFLQAAFLVLAGFIAWRWIAEMLDTRRLSQRAKGGILIGSLAILLIDPSVYYSAALPFHFEAFATVFALGAARSLWRGRIGKAGWWSGAALLCGSLGGLYVAGIGLSGLLSGRRVRLPALALLVSGCVWIGLIGTLHDNHGSLTDQYAYLAGRSTLPAGFGAALLLLKGIVAHPVRTIHSLTSRGKSHFIVHYLDWGGFVGLFTPWGFGVPALILLTSGLQQTRLFIGEPFQQRAVIPFVLFGTAFLVAALVEWLAAVGSRGARWHGILPRSRLQLLYPGAAMAVSLVVLTGSLFAALQQLPNSFHDTGVPGVIPAGEAASLREILARTPASAEVIVSLPISGRFADHRYLYLYLTNPPQPIPVNANTVVLVLDDAHTLPAGGAVQDAEAIDYVRTHFGARIIGSGLDVEAVEWQASPGQAPLLLP